MEYEELLGFNKKGYIMQKFDRGIFEKNEQLYIEEITNFLMSNKKLLEMLLWFKHNETVFPIYQQNKITFVSKWREERQLKDFCKTLPLWNNEYFEDDCHIHLMMNSLERIEIKLQNDKTITT